MSDHGGEGRQGMKGSHTDDRYAAQRRLGFPWLRFAADLEEDYRDSYIGINAMRMRASAFIGLFGVVGFLILDNYLGSDLLPDTGDLVLLLVTIPSAVV